MDAALGYAAKGWLVLPLKARSKEPATAHGVNDATVDQEQIVRWWLQDPEYNIGLAVGASGLVVIDIDPRNDGFTGWDQVAGNHAANTASVYTGAKGIHWYFSGAGKYRSKLAEGVDVKSEGGYVVAPPSVHPDGGVYQWVRDDVQPVPDWLAELLAKPEREASAPVEYDPNDNRPGSRFIRDSNWPDLMTGWGYKECGTGVDGQVFWTRPGKDSGISAVTGGETDTLYVFSSSTAFEAGKPYNRFSAYVHMEFDGDFSRAASALADRPAGYIEGSPDLTPAEWNAVTEQVSASWQRVQEVLDRKEVTSATEYAFLFGVSE